MSSVARGHKPTQQPDQTWGPMLFSSAQPLMSPVRPDHLLLRVATTSRGKLPTSNSIGALRHDWWLVLLVSMGTLRLALLTCQLNSDVNIAFDWAAAIVYQRRRGTHTRFFPQVRSALSGVAAVYPHRD